METTNVATEINIRSVKRLQKSNYYYLINFIIYQPGGSGGTDTVYIHVQYNIINIKARKTVIL